MKYKLEYLKHFIGYKLKTCITSESGADQKLVQICSDCDPYPVIIENEYRLNWAIEPKEITSFPAYDRVAKTKLFKLISGE